MRVLRGDRWVDAALDPHLGSGLVRVQVLAWLPLLALDDLTFRRPFSPRLVWNYVREIGFRGTAQKIASRFGERFRNDAYLAAGVGRVLEVSPGSDLVPGSIVEMIAPRHPLAVERVVIARRLVRVASGEVVGRLGPARLLLLSSEGGAVAPVQGAGQGSTPSDDLFELAGWAPESGITLARNRIDRALDRARSLLVAARWDDARALDIAPPSAVAERRSYVQPASPARPAAIKRAILFGYGNYAKTAILPSLPHEIRVDAIHEIDPLQIPPASALGGPRVAWDTAPGLREGERADVVFVAGFHHTHADLAVAALERGCDVVVEKPLATTAEQLTALTAALRLPGRRLFACFQKRYSPLNRLALEDLGVSPGDPISYHAIVYEVPLPARHWYRWPSSRSRLVSNGCHWLDHFLYLNDFAAVTDVGLTLAPDGTASSTVALENGAFFTLALTDQGSERLGVQDHVELRARGVTVTIENGAVYRAESRDRVLRRRRVNRLSAYRRMYRMIGRAIVDGAPGDSLRSVETSTELALRVDRIFDDQLRLQWPDGDSHQARARGGCRSREGPL